MRDGRMADNEVGQPVPSLVGDLRP
jgi:hypothetical protein